MLLHITVCSGVLLIWNAYIYTVHTTIKLHVLCNQEGLAFSLANETN